MKLRSMLVLPSLSATALLAFGLLSSAASAAPTTQLSITGEVTHAGVYDLAGLQALPAVTQTVQFSAGGGAPQTHTYTGASLWDTLDGAGIKTDPNVKNDILSKYVVATGSDGYRVAYAAGELSPNFGNKPDLIAYAETVNGVSAPLGADGFARTTAPGDVKGGRYVSNLADLYVGGAPAATVSGGGTSSSFTVTGDVVQAASFDFAALKALPSRQETIGSTVYTGVSFWDLLNTSVGLSTDAAVKNDVLGMIVVATGTDGYRAAFSLGELNPGFGNQPDLIAYEANGKPLEDNGFARIVVPNDIKAGRFVSNLVSLDVFHVVSPVPEPATMALMLVGLVVVGWKARRSTPTSDRALAA